LFGKFEKSRNTAYLDPHHQYFILVDGDTLEFGGEVDFRSKLESYTSKYYTPISKLKRQVDLDCLTDEMVDQIPLVLLVLGGGPNTIFSIKEALSNGTPCVIFSVSKANRILT